MQILQKGRQITATSAPLILVVVLNRYGGFLPQFLRSQFSPLPGEEVTPALPSLNFHGSASPLSQHALGLARSPAVCFLASQGRPPAITCDNFPSPWQKCGSRRGSADRHLRSSSRLLTGGREISLYQFHTLRRLLSPDHPRDRCGEDSTY